MNDEILIASMREQIESMAAELVKQLPEISLKEIEADLWSGI
jgi:hypothetical protein